MTLPLVTASLSMSHVEVPAVMEQLWKAFHNCSIATHGPHPSLPMPAQDRVRMPPSFPQCTFFGARHLCLPQRAVPRSARAPRPSETTPRPSSLLVRPPGAIHSVESRSTALQLAPSGHSLAGANTNRLPAGSENRRSHGMTSCAGGCWGCRSAPVVVLARRTNTQLDRMVSRRGAVYKSRGIGSQANTSSGLSRSFSSTRATIESILGLIASDLTARSSASSILDSSWSSVSPLVGSSDHDPRIDLRPAGRLRPRPDRP
jgi:hypothetical protein